jgi:Ni2+-binding GTPase involved in maturation of urease and hydrogenase
MSGQSVADRPNSVKTGLTANRTARRSQNTDRAVVENDAYTAFCARVIRAAGRRIAGGDVEGLPDLAKLAHDLDDALTEAVSGLRRAGYSWTEIANRLGVTKQAAQQRWRIVA